MADNNISKDVLDRKMYITRKARINTAERLKATENFIQAINVYYSIFLTALSIYSVNNSTVQLSLVTTVFSVALTIVIMFLATKGYGERARQLKNNYIEIESISICLSQTSEDNQEDINNIYAQYLNALDTSENHNSSDYYKALMSIPEEKAKLSKEAALFYNICIWSPWIIKGLLIIFPFCLRYITQVLEFLIKV